MVELLLVLMVQKELLFLVVRLLSYGLFSLCRWAFVISSGLLMPFCLMVLWADGLCYILFVFSLLALMFWAFVWVFVLFWSRWVVC